MKNSMSRSKLGFAPKSITWAMIIYFGILVALPLSSILILGIPRVTSKLSDQALEKLQLVAEARNSEIELWLKSNQTGLEAVITDSTQNQRMVSLLSTEGPILPSSRPTTVRTLTRFLQEQIGQQTGFTEMSLYTVVGDIAVSTNAELVETSISSEAYYTRSLEGQSFIQAPFFNETANTLQAYVLVPIIDTNGNQVGVLSGLLNLNELQTILSSHSGLGDTGQAYLVTKEGTWGITDTSLNQSGLSSEGISKALDGHNGTGEYQNYNDQDVVGSYRWIAPLNAALIAEIDANEAFSASNEIRNLALTISLIAIVITVFVSSLLSIQLTRPIGELTRVANEIADGDFSLRTSVTSQNEIGQLSRAFNSMTDRLLDNFHKLRIASAQAQEATRLKSEFLAVMSHELRTPLNAIIGFSGIILMSDAMDDMSRHQVKRIQANSERLLSLINDILDISRIEAGRMEIIQAPLSLRDLIQKIKSQMEILAVNKNLEFHVMIDPTLPPVIQSDTDALTKIITNLVSNAVKFTEEGSVSLNVNYKDRIMEISVTDTGIGIPPHMHETVFEAFRQADSSSKRKYGGTGLGLAIVQSLCNAMDGTVKLQSELGVGSTFTVTLPVQVVGSTEMEFA